MERQLKERLVGAAVLVAVAIILIPEMLSGPRESSSNALKGNSSNAPVQLPSEAPSNSGASGEPGTIKTYTIDLQQRESRQDTSTEAATVQAAAIDAKVPPSEVIASDVQPTTTQRARPAVGREPKLASDQPTNKSTPIAGAPASVKPEALDPVPAPISVAAKGNWAVQVASLGTRAAADRLAAELKSGGYAAFVMPFQAGSKNLFRVRVGPVIDRRAADALLAQVKRQHASATVVPHP
ncbi:MAG: SPOR domain-containing protein [Candidatus Obscuribacterales bacterium]|nr:SPOR domain-containing protein [Steroidobacteraceae bacterium]